MKKMILTLAIAVCTLSLSAFAGEVRNVSEKVLKAFNTEFNTAKEVEWTVGSDYYMASFRYNDNYVYAYYSEEGELLGLSRNISPADLPLNLQTSLKKDFTSYWVSDLLEVAKSESTSYYITLENADTKIVLKASGGNGWSQYKKVKKS
ncbi:MAG: hypothetical protein JNM19_00235 [Chitinophagaceae bacterium]|nr:hypothetical protein [Chitinophagaceae bacterium]